MSSFHVCLSECISQPHPVCTCETCRPEAAQWQKSSLHAALHQELLAAATNSSPTATTNSSLTAAANSSPSATANSTSNPEWIFPHEIGDRVEVYWPAEKQWFVGDIADICDEEEQFHVHYIDDGEELWHAFCDMDEMKV